MQSEEAVEAEARSDAWEAALADAQTAVPAACVEFERVAVGVLRADARHGAIA